MGNRLSTEQRRLQLVRGALQLLAEGPVEALTTRRLAEAVGLTQPALFRHFASRAALLEAVVTHLRTDLEARAAERLGSLEEADGRAALEALAGTLFAFVERHPAARRLLFHDVASGTAGGAADLGAPLRRLVAGQVGPVAGLVEAAVERGELPAGLDPAAAGRRFVGLVQGELVGWHLAGAREADGGRPDLTGGAPALVAFFWAALGAGHPARDGSVAPATSPAEDLVVFDARPLLDAGRDPFDEIHDQLGRLAPGGVLALVTPFRPRPLEGLLTGRGFAVDVLEPVHPGGVAHVMLVHAGAAVLDLVDLPAPEPMEAVLRAAADLAPGASLVARLPRFPNLLLPRLDERGLVHLARPLPDDLGGSVLRLDHPAAR